MKNIRLKDRQIGDDHPAFIIAEIGSNHNLDKSIAFELIENAAIAKVDAVKFQLFKGTRHYSKFTPKFNHIKDHPVDLLKKLELPEHWIPELKEYAEKKGLVFICSVTSGRDVDLLSRTKVDMIKIASFEIVDLPLIQHAAKHCSTILISTGMANFGEIEDAYNVCKSAGNGNIVFFQCASAYPAPPEIMNLAAMQTIQKMFPDTVVGLSDHTLGTMISPVAVALGARVIEKHFTLDNKMEGPDHRFALNPDELGILVQNIREVEVAMGNGQKLKPSDAELEYYQKARRSIHARTDIPKGESITQDKIIIKRPGFGIHPKHIDIVTSKTAKTNIKADQWITWDLI